MDALAPTPTTNPAAEKRNARVRDYLRIARPDHWIKNLFILPGVLAALVLVKDEAWTWPALAAKVVLAFVATSLVASANYVINEWLDAKFDRFHPKKKNRPVVVAELRAGWVYAEYAILAVAGLACSFAVNPLFGAMGAWLFVMGILYNVEPFRTKDVPYLDVLSESVNNMIRLLMGWFTVAHSTIPPCSLILGYWMCGAYLMGMKRFAEYRMIGDPERAGLYRKSFRHYSENMLVASSFCYALAATFLIGIFLVKYRVELVFSVPFLIGLFGKYTAIAWHDDSSAQKPEKLFREKRLMVLAAVFFLSLVIGLVLDMPWLSIFTSDNLYPIRSLLP
ncbi:MAG: UbiA prenyltransferase family protein [Kiritimatiellae bacterium]|nr:UbiA prenyltransferase family protein [Kiritimatiellia bacterium]